MKTAVVSALALLVLAGGALVVRSGGGLARPGAASEEALFTVKRGALAVTVTENGSLFAKKSEKVNYQGERGGGKITFLIEEGKTVEADEVLCRIDSQEMEQQLQQLDLEIKKSTVDLKSAQTEFEIQKGENAANIEKARIALDKAQKEQEKYRDGDAPKERRSLAVKIKEAQTKHSRAKKKYEDSLKLLTEDYISKSQVEQDEIEFEQAQIALESAERDVELFEKYTLPMTSAEKQTALSDAERGLQNANLRAQSTLEQKEVTVRGTEQRLGAQKRQFEQLTKEIEKCVIKSPGPGLVLHGDPQQHYFNERMKLGGNVWGGQTLFTIPDLRVMQVQVQVHEADINKLKEAQPATVTMDTYPGLVLKGEVSKIAQVAGSQTPWGGDDDVKKFKVEITLEQRADLALRPGISAKAEIFVEQREAVLYVPRQAIFLEEGRHFCHVQQAGRIERREIAIDVSSDLYSVVVSGLSEGDRVLLYNPALAAGASANGSKAAATQPAPTADTPAPVAP